MGEFTEEGADFVEDFQVGRGAGADGFGDWGLVDCDDTSDFLVALDVAVREYGLGGFVFLLEDCRNEGIEDQRAFSGTGDTDNGAEAVQWEFEIYIF